MTAMNEVRSKMQKGTAIPCTASYGLSKQKEMGFTDIELAYALSSPWAAGIGTVRSIPNCLELLHTNMMQTTIAVEIAICRYLLVIQQDLIF